MQHDLVRILGRVVGISLAPVVAHSVGKDRAAVVECSRGDRATDFGVALETVFGVLVPKVECAIASRSAEGAVHGVE